MASSSVDSSLVAQEEEEQKENEEKSQTQEKSTLPDDPRCAVHYKAQDAFLQGDFTVAQQLLISYNQKELTDDDYHHQLFLEKGHNHRMIYRNNLAILKEATLSGGSAEVLFRVSLDDAFKYTKDPLLAQSLSHSSMEKLEKEMDMVRYNLGLSWLMNPNHSRAAFSAFIYGIKQFPMDIRLWLHTAEACISYLCSKTSKKQSYLVTPNLDVYFRCDNLQDELDTLRAYFPNHDNTEHTVLPTFEFAEMCLMNAKKLARSDNPISINLLSEPGTKRNSPVDEPLYLTILTTSSYVSLRLHKFRSSLETANKVLTSKNIPRVQKVLAKCYRDLSLFLLGEADWTVFTPISFEEEDQPFATDNLEDNARKFLANVNATRKYHHILGFVTNPANKETAVSRLREYVNETGGSLSRENESKIIKML